MNDNQVVDITAAQQELIDEMVAAAQATLDVLQKGPHNHELLNAKIKLEEMVMWAAKGIARAVPIEPEKTDGQIDEQS